MQKLLIAALISALFPLAACQLTGMTLQSADPLSPVQVPHNLNQLFQEDIEELRNEAVYHIEVNIEPSDEGVALTGKEKVRFTNQEMVPLKEIYFRLLPNHSGDYLSVSNVTVNGESAAIALAYQDTALRVDLPQPLEIGASLEIAMDFDAMVPTSMGGNYGLYIYMEDIIALDAFFPFIPVYDRDGWQVFDPPMNGDLVFADVAFFEVKVNIPQEFIVASSGTEVHREVSGERKTITYHGGPQRDFYLAASPNFATKTALTKEGVRVTSYFLEEYREAGEMVLQVGLDALDVFWNRYGPYPYTELDLVSTPMMAGGMEYSNIVALGLNNYNPMATAGGVQGSVFLEAAAAHEVGHQWFYNQVMNDQIHDPWMDEGMVQYATYLYFVDTYGQDDAQGFYASLEERWGLVENAPIPIGRSAGDYSQIEYSAIIYGRAPLFMDALRQEMGEQAFSDFLKNYVETYRWQEVTPQDFLLTLEQSCDCDLNAIFAQWIYEPRIDGE